MMMMSFGWIGLIAFILIIYLVLTLLDDKSIKKDKKNALSILDERYARGEITDEEYLHMKKLISK